MAGTIDHGPDGHVISKAPEAVTSTTKVNVAFPFSQVKIAEPTDHLVALTALLADLARLMAETTPGQKAERLSRRAQDLAASLR